MERVRIISIINMNINDEKDLRPSPKTHPIDTNTRPRQLSPFNDQLADFREPPPPLRGQNSLTDHKKTSDVPLSLPGKFWTWC